MKRILFLLFSLISIIMSPAMKSQTIKNIQYQIIEPIDQKLQWLTFGEIKPTGWLREQMLKDLDGFVGHLDEGVHTIVREDQQKAKYFTYGPLVFAKPVESREIITKTFPVEPFRDFAYLPVKKIDYRYSDEKKPVIKFDPEAGKNQFWKRISMKTTLLNEKTGKPEPVTLYPAGATILRQVTFRTKEDDENKVK